MIHLASELHWQIRYITHPERFFSALQIILPYGSTLYFEGHVKSKELQTFLSRYPCKWPHRTNRLKPLAMSGHACFLPDFVNDITSFDNSHLLKDFHHLYGYGEKEMLFDFHDAFTGGDLRINRSISASSIQLFCASLAPTLSLEEPIV